MRILDEKFRKNKLRYIFQCTLAALLVFIILLAFDAMTNAVIIAALGSSVFIVFAMPEAQVSRPRFLIGGYIVSIAVACLCHHLSLLSLHHLSLLSLWSLMTWTSFIHESSHVLFGAIAVGLAIFVMVITDTEHPPAAGLTLGLIVNEWSYMTIVVVFVGIILLSAIRFVLKPVLKNLL
jgi:CBS-domain-containing membrane protein